MINGERIIDFLVESRIIGVIRTGDLTTALELARAFTEGGLKVVEVTSTIPGWEMVLSEAVRMAGEDVCLGLGSVMTSEQIHKAVELGAKFVVSPVFIGDVVASGRVLEVPVIPGALTPTEIYQAVNAGVDIVKVFPVSAVGGPGYIKALLGPMPGLKLIPTGGVQPDDAAEYIRAGALAVGMGTNLAPRDALEKRDWRKVSQSVADFLASLKAALKGGAE